jgi:1-acyl-sn-glycerol-3-phosphate acyltransferase
MEVRGRENIPAGGFIVVGKHQSLWETFALITLFEDPCFILKRELSWIPLFGWYVWKGDMIAIDRRAGAPTIALMNAKAAQEIADGRQILIFAEGTRRPVGAPPAYKQGFSHLYAEIGAAILPLALNSGVYWPRRKFLRKPGTVLVEIMPAIPPGLPRTEAYARTVAAIEASSTRLLAEAGWRGANGGETAR